MKHASFILCALAALFVTSAAAAEEGIPPSPIVKTALVIDAAAVKPGQPIWAGVTFTMPEHWHIYWQNPGDSGIPTRYTWTLPEGITAGDIAWPAPERLEVSGLVNYGYSGVVTLPVPITVAREGIRGDITVKADWLVCRDICIPESATFTAPLASTPGAGPTIAKALAAVPKPVATQASYRIDGNTVIISPGLTVGFTPKLENGGAIAHWFPIEDGIISNVATQRQEVDENLFGIFVPRGSAEPLPEWRGVLSIHMKDDNTSKSFAITAKNTTPETPATTNISVPSVPSPVTAPTTPPTSLWLAVALAFVGGLILNIMPCVLPILALKALAIAKKAQISRAAAARQGIAYTVGVIASFLVIAGVMLALKASGSAIGWGFQLQNTGFVALLTLIMLLVSANLLGLFELPVLFGSKATGVNENSIRGSLLTGGLAVMVATPCTAPFMATAVGATLALPTAQSLLVFAMLGLGMAAPFLLISLWPAALRLLPKPGAWMHRFKQLLAIPMLATAAWLIWVLVQLHSGPMKMEIHHEAYSPARLTQLRAEGTPVLVDATAAWCLTCKVNERVALKPEAMQQFFRERGVITLVADWTNSDPTITEYLASFGRNGVPLVVYYPPHAEPKVLPQILTPELVRAAIAP